MIEEDNKTLWCGNLAEQVTEELLYELFLQAGPLEKVRIPRDRDGRQKNFAFITFCHEVSVPYAIGLFRGTSLFHRALNLDTRGRVTRLPPPIRSGTDALPITDFNGQANIAKQFADMTERLWEENPRPSHMPTQRPERNDKLVMASLQGNWSHRHHPYKPKENKAQHQNEYRHKDDKFKRETRNKHNSWRDRRGYGNRRRD
ncbi:RNA-binding protein 7 [Maniola hyperantus]|uniref:RNA-binding protein 7 n=1 Tax=Aphantopus hyperantus TaxID=2795564 RepID=UPI0015697711|nr:RNA-binding protein 7 [Maniola hyperantus]XP_034826835.1 RNA-binding protein 7 [Maniola hyperantus]